jgi:hypothetical protein
LFRILNKGVIPPSLSPELLHLLRSINVLVPDDYAIWCKQRKKQLIAEGRECLKRDGFFVIVSSFLLLMSVIYRCFGFC